MLKIQEPVHFKNEFELWDAYDQDGQIDLME